MKIALIGYGKMGHMIERIAEERGHEIVAIVDVDNLSAFDAPEFASADVAIEFTAPSEAIANYRRAWAKGLPVVSGTTGWTDFLPELKEEIKAGGHTLFWASNFSIGVNILFAINRKLAEIMSSYPQYAGYVTEIHHTAKKDAPSGTAITIADDVIANNKRFDKWAMTDDFKPETVAQDGVLPIKAIRMGAVPGTHIVQYNSPVDVIELKHEAKSRDGFALGAVMAAEFVVGKKGFFSMNDMLDF